MSSIVELREIHHRFANSGEMAYVLRGVSLSVGPKEVVAVVGESGCGKTTLGRIVVGLQRPTGGSVLFEGRDIWEARRHKGKTFRRAVQLVHQPITGMLPSGDLSNALAAQN